MVTITTFPPAATWPASTSCPASTRTAPLTGATTYSPRPGVNVRLLETDLQLACGALRSVTLALRPPLPVVVQAEQLED